VNSYSFFFCQHLNSLNNVTGTTNLTQVTFRNLWGLSNYDFQVAAHNLAGLGAFTTAITEQTRNYTIPGPPTGAPENSTARTITINWISPVETGGYPIQGYYVDLETPSGIMSVYTTDTSYTFTDLDPSETYNYTVLAVTAFGNSTLYASSASTTGEHPLEIFCTPTHHTKCRWPSS